VAKATFESADDIDLLQMNEGEDWVKVVTQLSLKFLILQSFPRTKMILINKLSNAKFSISFNWSAEHSCRITEESKL
jgi:hypothetical protein